jgi:prepilin-type processing-associated H-X9-DG protein
LLIAVLLPALSKAREAARQVKCLSNMRQLSQATMQFATEHKGWLPGRAGSGFTKFTDSGGVANGSATDAKTPADWIAWQRTKDPINGAADGADQNITYSALARYLNARYIETTTADAANDVNATLESVYRCPSDNLDQRPNATSTGAYRYSYSMNDFVSVPIQPPKDGSNNGIRHGFTFTGKLTSIRKPSEVILFVCEDEKTIDDGVFKPAPQNWDTGSVNAVAARHELKVKRARGATFTADGKTDDARGNVSFCDGHGEFLSRKDAIRQRYTGNPTDDPANF